MCLFSIGAAVFGMLFLLVVLYLMYNTSDYDEED
jgi:cbb3-type cytochrome oxidase subunit 3